MVVGIAVHVDLDLCLGHINTGVSGLNRGAILCQH